MQAPRNLEAEQSLLGAIIYDASLLDDLTLIRSSHFFDPVHGRLFEAVKTRHQANELVDAITLATAFDSDDGLKQIGGVNYLATLLNEACDGHAVADYARIVTDMAARRAIIAACQTGVERASNVSLSDGSEASRIASDIEGALQRIEDVSAAGAGVLAGRIAGNLASRLQDKVDGKEWDLLTFGLPEIDQMLGPVGKNDVIILGGRTSMGKSAVAQQMAQMIAEQGRGVAFFAMEMSEEQMAARLLASYSTAPVAYSDIARGKVDKWSMGAIHEATRRVEALPIVFDHRGGLRPSEVIAACRKFKRSMAAQGVELGLVVIDHIGLMASDEPSSNDYARMSSVARKLKEIAKAVGCAVLACTQINREGEKRDGNRPTRADLRDSGHIEEIADAIILTYRPAYYTQRNPPREEADLEDHEKWRAKLEREKHRLELIFDKVRMGSTGCVDVWFDPATTRVRSSKLHVVNGGKA
jgi:replicative DNA helicase